MVNKGATPMDYGLLNALGMTIMAGFGLWALHYGLSKEKNVEKSEKVSANKVDSDDE